MGFIITAPSSDIEEYEGIRFHNGVATVIDLRPELHAHLSGIGYSVAPRVS